MIHTFEPKSSHIRKVTYDTDRLTMAVTFHDGRTYEHKVPEQVYENMTKYRSSGEFYHRVLKRYPILRTLRVN